MYSDEQTNFLANIDRSSETAVLSSKEGMLFLAALIEFCGVNSQIHFNDEQNPLATAFRDGRRNIGLYLLNIIYSKDTTESAYNKAVCYRNEARRLDLNNDKMKGDMI